MKAARIVKPNEPLRVLELETPKAKGSQELVKVVASGFCHGDIHLWEGGYEGPRGQFLKTTDRGVNYPVTPGAEIAGFIEAIDEKSQSLCAKGDKTLVYPWIGEGTCPACRIGEENLCDKPKSLNSYVDGGYADQ